MADLQETIERFRTVLVTGEAPDPELYQMAATYDTACRELNSRMTQCNKLLQKGLRSEALRLADLDPPILDHFSVLDFPEREEWVRYARQQSLPAPPPLQVALAAEINHAFAEEEPLKEVLRRHRLLALARAPLRLRLILMRRLAKLDNMNHFFWEADIRTFEDARLREIEGEVASAAREKQGIRLQELVGELSSGEWRKPPTNALLAGAQEALAKVASQSARVKIEDVEKALTDAVAAGDKDKALALYPRAQQLAGSAALPADHPVMQRLDLAFYWIQQQELIQDRQRRWQAACDELRNQIATAPLNVDLQNWIDQVAQLDAVLPDDIEKALEEREKRRKSSRRFRLW